MLELGFLLIGFAIWVLPFVVLYLLNKRRVRLTCTITGAVYGALAVPLVLSPFLLASSGLSGYVYFIWFILMLPLGVVSWVISFLANLIGLDAPVFQGNRVDWLYCLVLVVACAAIGALLDWCRAPWRAVRPRA